MPIEPDLKDWTWVLERRCPECGFSGAEVDVADLGRMIRDNALAWTAVLGADDVAERPSEDRWSPLEYACHVRDVFRIYDERLALMLTEDDPPFPNWDQDASAVDDAYNDQDAAVVATEIVMAGNRLADAFDAVTGDQWERTGVRSDGVAFTVDTFGRYFIHDPIHHLVDVGAGPPG
ncbi:MAG: DinB family protein [Acidimicrobiales bacterium]